VFAANFPDPGQAWLSGSSADEAESVSGNDYVIERKTPGQAIPLPNFIGVTPVDLVNVALTTTFQINTASPGGGAGVACRDIHSHAYVFTVGPASSPGQLAWSISRQDTSASLQDTAVNRQLASGTVAAPGPGPVNLEGDCVGGGKNHAPVTLVMSLGSQVVGQAVDTNLPTPYFGASSVQVTGTKGQTAATFSAFQIRAATAQ
jgi:hypothetical protein